MALQAAFKPAFMDDPEDANAHQQRTSSIRGVPADHNMPQNASQQQSIGQTTNCFHHKNNLMRQLLLMDGASAMQSANSLGDDDDSVENINLE